MPLLAQFATGMWRMSGALRRLLFIQIKNDLGRFSFGSVFFVRIKKMNSPTGRKLCLQHLNDPTSVDELNVK
ncbi:hypothetical protein DS885_00110 [Psychromonas sp. B3M02]|nr:hypothetical protein DS885_00110 [Psychromonas sp. B3M02]